MLNYRKDSHFVHVSGAAVYAEQLRSADLRVTRSRIAVLHVVHANPHAETETILRAVRACLPDVSRQAVYDIVRALTDAGLVRRVQPAGSPARYESRVGDNHHHMVCRSCGAMADVDCAAVGDVPCLTVSATSGFQLDEAEVTFWGLCPNCSESDASQGLGDYSPTEQDPDEMLCPSNTRSLPPHILIDTEMPPSNGQPMPTPTPRPGEWLAPAVFTPNTLLKAAGIGTGGLWANVGLAHHDVADATVTGNMSLSFRAGSTQT